MGDRLVILGSKGGPSVRQGQSNPTSVLLEIDGEPIIIDCGIGVSRATVEAGAKLADIRKIFITHLHSDHVLEFGPLVYTAWTTALKETLRAWGPKGTKEYYANFLKAMNVDHSIRVEDEGRTPLTTLVEIDEYTEGLVYQDEKLKVTSLKNIHPPFEETYALRFEWNGKCVVFSGDTTYLPALADFAKGANVLVHEAISMEGIDELVAMAGNTSNLKQHLINSHTLTEDVGRIATASGVPKLILYHVVPSDHPRLDREWFKASVANTYAGEILVSYDGFELSL